MAVKSPCIDVCAFGGKTKMDGKVLMDGSLVDWRDATIHVLIPTLHYRMGVFEGARVSES